MVNGKYWAKVSKRGITEKKRDEIENLYLNAHLHINMKSHIYFLMCCGRKCCGW